MLQTYSFVLRRFEDVASTATRMLKLAGTFEAQANDVGLNWILMVTTALCVSAAAPP